MGEITRKYKEIPTTPAKHRSIPPSGIVRLLALVAMSVPITLFQSFMVLFRLPGWWPGAALWHRTAARIMRMDVEVRGCPQPEGPVLYAANHISWLDILALGGVLRGASFVSKHEVASVFITRWMLSLHKTILVNRGRRSETHAKANELAERVAKGDSLILFPESTTTLGQFVAPFKSSLFSVAERAAAADGDMLVQPVTLSYVALNGQPMVRSRRPWVAWFGEMGFVSHLLQLMRVGRIKVIIELHEPVHLKDFGNRKAIAAHCEKAVREGLERIHRLEYRHGRQRQRR